MANQRHVDMLVCDGIEAWNRWREEVPTVRPDLRRAVLSGAELTSANLNRADLTRASLAEAHLSKAYLYETRLTGADLTGAELSEAHLRRAHLSGAHLSGAHLSGAYLNGVDLSRADLRHAILRGADLREANLTEANLSGADLREANLTEANLSGANLSETTLVGANLSKADLNGANLNQANLSQAICVMTNFSGAILSRCIVYGIAAWDLKLEATLQADLRITPEEEESHITVDNLQVAQFLYLLLHNEEMRAVLDTITSKVVLILGRFGERKLVVDALREALRHHPNGYIPVLFDFEPQLEKPILETVKTLANLARFVLADLTDPHMVRAELTAIVPHVPTVPIQPIIEGNASLPTEYESWALYRSFLPVYRYVDLSHLLASLAESVITPIEAHVQARRL